MEASSLCLLCENCAAEIAWVHALHPECSCYADVYASHGLLTNRTILAHAVHLSVVEYSSLSQWYRHVYCQLMTIAG